MDRPLGGTIGVTHEICRAAFASTPLHGCSARTSSWCAAASAARKAVSTSSSGAATADILTDRHARRCGAVRGGAPGSPLTSSAMSETALAQIDSSPRAATAPASIAPSKPSSARSTSSAPPVYVRGEIVHNRHVVETLSAPGRSSSHRTRGARGRDDHAVGPRRGARGARQLRGRACGSSTRPARWSARCTPRSGVTPTAARPSCWSAIPTTTR